jgi:hypothetical protein
LRAALVPVDPDLRADEPDAERLRLAEPLAVDLRALEVDLRALDVDDDLRADEVALRAVEPDLRELPPLEPLDDAFREEAPLDELLRAEGPLERRFEDDPPLPLFDSAIALLL